MAVTVFIPEKRKRKGFSAYIHGKVVVKYYEKNTGSLFRIEGTAVIFYAYSNYRRAAVFTEAEGTNPALPLLEGNIPLVKQKVKILYSAERRRFDLLKFFLYRTEKEFGEEIFSYPTAFWLRAISLLDDYRPAKRQSAANARKIRRLVQQ